MRRALIIGLDHYPEDGLDRCASDAAKIAKLLAINPSDGKPNFHVKLVTSEDDVEISASSIEQDLKVLFGDVPCDTALFYFAGHGEFSEAHHESRLLISSGDGSIGSVSLSSVARMAQLACEKGYVRSAVIILDCCQSGSIGELSSTSTASVAKGMTILAAADRKQSAYADENGGLFSQVLIHALEGASADLLGRITPASIYSHVDQALGPWARQRPVYKANVQDFVTLREVTPRIPRETLREIPEWFEKEAQLLALDPSFEPDIDEELAAKFDPAVRAANMEVFEKLQLCNRHGLIEPVDAKHMYFAAIDSTGCRLTVLGQHYWRLVKKNQI